MLFQIDLAHYRDIEMGLMYHLQSLTPSEIASWPFWEFEDRVEKLNEILKKKQDAENKANKDANSQQGSFNPQKSADSFLKQAHTNMPKMPNNIKIPKL